MDTTAFLVTGISVLADLSVIIAFVISRSRFKQISARKEGEHVKVHEQLQKDLDRAHEKVRKIEADQNQTATGVARIEAKMDGLEKWLARIDGKLEARA